MPRRPPRHRPRKARLPEGRPCAAARGYDLRWRLFRAAYLVEHPFCARCEADGVLAPATQIDHKVPLRAGGGRFDESNLEALCASHHSRKTALHDGGFGRGGSPCARS